MFKTVLVFLLSFLVTLLLITVGCSVAERIAGRHAKEKHAHMTDEELKAYIDKRNRDLAAAGGAAAGGAITGNAPAIIGGVGAGIASLYALWLARLELKRRKIEKELKAAAKNDTS